MQTIMHVFGAVPMGTTDKKGRPEWKMPKPKYVARHFNNQACRRRFEAREITYEQATHEVPIYRGLGRSSVVSIVEGVKYQRRLQARKSLLSSTVGAAKKMLPRRRAV